MEWIATVLTSEFLWGTILGIALSALSARATIYFQAAAQAKTVINFSDDLIKNISDYAASLQEARERSNAIHFDILALIENEIGIWSRNREHLFVIKDEMTRKNLRDYFSRCSKLVVDTRVSLHQFGESIRIADSQGEDDAGPNRQTAYRHLSIANQSCDKLVAHIKASPKLLGSR